jgi:hypothetical protein
MAASKDNAKATKKFVGVLWTCMAIVTLVNARSLWTDYGTLVAMIGILVPLGIATVAVYVIARHRKE